jgi:hypothetical protein
MSCTKEERQHARTASDRGCTGSAGNIRVMPLQRTAFGTQSRPCLLITDLVITSLPVLALRGCSISADISRVRYEL